MDKAIKLGLVLQLARIGMASTVRFLRVHWQFPEYSTYVSHAVTLHVQTLVTALSGSGTCPEHYSY